VLELPEIFQLAYACHVEFLIPAQAVAVPSLSSWGGCLRFAPALVIGRKAVWC
jgi:hypothetical protein